MCSDKCLVHLYQLRYLIFGNLISLSWSVKKQDALCFYRLSRHDGILDGNNTRDDDLGEEEKEKKGKKKIEVAYQTNRIL